MFANKQLRYTEIKFKMIFQLLFSEDLSICFYFNNVRTQLAWYDKKNDWPDYPGLAAVGMQDCLNNDCHNGSHIQHVCTYVRRWFHI